MWNISLRSRRSNLFVLSLNSLSLSLCRFGPERRARPAAKVSASTSPCRHGWRTTHMQTQTGKKKQKNSHISHMCFQSCKFPHAYEPKPLSSACTPTHIHTCHWSASASDDRIVTHLHAYSVNRTHNQVQIHTASFYTKINTRMHAISCLSLRHTLFLKLWAHLHTFSHAWTHPLLSMSARLHVIEHPTRL